MAVLRDTPYAGGHFLVDLGDGETGPAGAFAEVSGISMAIDVIPYRTGADPESGVRKQPGLARYGDVTLRRGLIGSRNLFQWMDAIRNGDTNARRTVRITALNEDHSQTVMTWILLRAWPIRFEMAPMTAMTADVAVEQLTLTHERLELE